MSMMVTLQLPDEAVDRYRRGATAARKPLEEFLLERLTESVPPRTDDLASPLDEELRQMEGLEDAALLEVACAMLPSAPQRRYDQLLRKNAEGALTAREEEALHAIGEEARRLTVRKAHAWIVLKWRGYVLPSLGELSSAE